MKEAKHIGKGRKVNSKRCVNKREKVEDRVNEEEEEEKDARRKKKNTRKRRSRSHFAKTNPMPVLHHQLVLV